MVFPISENIYWNGIQTIKILLKMRTFLFHRIDALEIRMIGFLQFVSGIHFFDEDCIKTKYSLKCKVLGFTKCFK